MVEEVTVTAPVNIAVIKYWGKRDTKLYLPINSSLSGTLDQADLRTETTARFLSAGEEDTIFLNGKKEDINNPRIQVVLRLLRSRAAPELAERPISLVSSNNFPTAAGLASSASGYCAMVFAVSKLLQIEGEISDVARQGSGSATRSLYGGFVKWEMGSEADGSDSIAIQVADEKHWDDMEMLILVASAEKKKVPSTAGMQETVKTCPGIEERIRVVPERMAAMEAAIREKNFADFAKLTMLDSDHFHELCHTTVPPIYYMNEVSKNVVALVNEFNANEIRAAYTFDAGPNAVIYLPRRFVPEFVAGVLRFFPPTSMDNFVNKSELVEQAEAVKDAVANFSTPQVMADGLQNIIYTRVGGGPVVVSQK